MKLREVNDAFKQAAYHMVNTEPGIGKLNLSTQLNFMVAFLIRCGENDYLREFKLSHTGVNASYINHVRVVEPQQYAVFRIGRDEYLPLMPKDLVTLQAALDQLNSNPNTHQIPFDAEDLKAIERLRDQIGRAEFSLQSNERLIPENPYAQVKYMPRAKAQ